MSEAYGSLKDAQSRTNLDPPSSPVCLTPSSLSGGLPPSPESPVCRFVPRRCFLLRSSPPPASTRSRILLRPISRYPRYPVHDNPPQVRNDTPDRTVLLVVGTCLGCCIINTPLQKGKSVERTILGRGFCEGGLVAPSAVWAGTRSLPHGGIRGNRRWGGGRGPQPARKEGGPGRCGSPRADDVLPSRGVMAGASRARGARGISPACRPVGERQGVLRQLPGVAQDAVRGRSSQGGFRARVLDG